MFLAEEYFGEIFAQNTGYIRFLIRGCNRLACKPGITKIGNNWVRVSYSGHLVTSFLNTGVVEKLFMKSSASAYCGKNSRILPSFV